MIFVYVTAPQFFCRIQRPFGLFTGSLALQKKPLSLDSQTSNRPKLFDVLRFYVLFSATSDCRLLVQRSDVKSPSKGLFANLCYTSVQAWSSAQAQEARKAQLEDKVSDDAPAVVAAFLT